MAQYQIVDGPSKFDLMISLMEGDLLNRKEVIFQLKPGVVPEDKLRVVIHSLTREDGSGDRWIFFAYVNGNNPPIKKVRGYFDITNHSGWLNEVTN